MKQFKKVDSSGTVKEVFVQQEEKSSGIHVNVLTLSKQQRKQGNKNTMEKKNRNAVTSSSGMHLVLTAIFDRDVLSRHGIEIGVSNGPMS